MTVVKLFFQGASVAEFIQNSIKIDFEAQIMMDENQ